MDSGESSVMFGLVEMILLTGEGTSSISISRFPLLSVCKFIILVLSYSTPLEGDRNDYIFDEALVMLHSVLDCTLGGTVAMLAFGGSMNSSDLLELKMPDFLISMFVGSGHETIRLWLGSFHTPFFTPPAFPFFLSY